MVLKSSNINHRNEGMLIQSPITFNVNYTRLTSNKRNCDDKLTREWLIWKGEVKVTGGPEFRNLEEFLNSKLLISRQSSFLPEQCPDGRDNTDMWSQLLFDRELSPVGDPISLKTGKLLDDARKCLQASTLWVPEKQEGRTSEKINFQLELIQRTLLYFFADRRK